jgi:pyroglutamyl-peptidase
MSKTILLTGFEPFGGETVNPSWLAVQGLHHQCTSDGSTVVALELPCVFQASRQVLAEAVAQYQPHTVLCVGQAGGSAELRLERVAINLVDARIADNAGAQPIDQAIVPDGPAAYFTSMPLKAMRAALHAKGIPATVSYSAGTYVCNHVFYGLMHEAARNVQLGRAGFVHIPYLPQQALHHAGAPSMALELVQQALLTVLETSIATAQDLALGAGSLH